jgi:signal transduction histidine kinase
MMDATSLEMAIGALQGRIDQMQEHLAQQNKLATLGMVTAVLAHEFNNILTPMISYTKYALGDKGDEALRNKALHKALSGAERLANISTSLLGFARGDESVSADVAGAVSETLACLSRDLGKDGITLTVEVEAGLKVAMNGGQLQQVLMNLIVNARSAMLGTDGCVEGGVIVGGRGRGRGGVKRLVVTGKVIKRGKIAEIRVSDTGPGIPEGLRGRVFEPFFSTKREKPGETGAAAEEGLPRGGTGLGLTICQELVAAAGGTIREEGEAGKGAVFVIEVPLAG